MSRSPVPGRSTILQEIVLKIVFEDGLPQRDVFFSKKILVIIDENHFECGGPEINAKIHFSSYELFLKRVQLIMKAV